MPSNSADSSKPSTRQRAGSAAQVSPNPAGVTDFSDDSSELSPIRKRLSRKTLTKIIIFGTIILAAVGYLVWDILTNGPITSFINNRDELIAIMKDWGALAPVLYILLQIAQTVVAPIPGQVVGSIGGFLFGPWGVLWTAIGTLVGSFIVFMLARRFGRPLLEKLFKKSAIEKFDFIINSKSSAFILFFIFLLPGFPDDLICYLAGLTAIPIPRLMLIMLLGRLPLIAVTNYIGSGIGDNVTAVVIVSIICVIVLGLAVWQRERIMGLFKRKSNPGQDKPKSNQNKR